MTGEVTIPQGVDRGEIVLERSLTAVAPEWERLAERTLAPPFAYPGWLEAWWSAFGAGELELLCLRRDGELAGLLPLCRDGRRLRSPTNWHTPWYGPLAVDAAGERRLIAGAFGLAAPCVELQFVDGDELHAFHAAAREHGREMEAAPLMRSPFVTLDGTWEEYERRLSRSRRRSLRRAWRKLEAEGRVEVEIVADGADLERRLAEAFALEASGWKGRAGTAIVSQPETRAFYADVARWAAARGQLRLAFLTLDGTAIACDYALELNGVWYSLKAGYDERFRSFGPGALLLHAELRDAFARGLTRFDLLGAEDEFKRSWTPEATARVTVHAYARGVAGRVERVRRRLRDRVEPRLRALRTRWGGASRPARAAR